MQQRKSVNFNEWETAYRDGFDGFVMLCGDSTAEGYAVKFREIKEVESVNVRHDGVHVNFKRDKPTTPHHENKKYIPYGVAFFAGYFISFTITFFVMYGR